MYRLRMGCSRWQPTGRPRCIACQSQQRWFAASVSYKTEIQSKWAPEQQKTFVRHEEPTGQIWYSLKTRLHRIKPRSTSKFFEMPDIVLDLDAEDQRGVRDFDNQDLYKLSRAWASNRKHRAMQAAVKTLEKEALRLRQRWEETMRQPASPWRVSPHDLMSVALRGVAGGSDQLHSNTVEGGDRPGLLRFLCQTNGMPEYAAEKDKSLLEWMLIRKGAMEQRVAAAPHDQHPTFIHFTEAVERAKSFLELRRVIATCSFGSLGNEHNAVVGFNTEGSVSEAIQNAVVRLLKGYESGSPQMEEAMREAMIMVTNAEISLRRLQPTESANLWIFGLQLSTSHSLPATIVLLCRGLDAGYETALPETRLQIRDAMESLAHALEDMTTSEAGQLLCRSVGNYFLRVLTGIEPVNQISTYSVRSFILSADSGDISPEVRFDMYASYIKLLGQLKAFRTLWAEYHHVRYTAEALQKEGDQETSHQRRLKQAIIASVMAAPRFETIQGPLYSRDPSLHACASADYYDLAPMRVPTNSPESSSNVQELDSLGVEAALEQPLNDYLEEVTRQQRGEFGRST